MICLEVALAAEPRVLTTNEVLGDACRVSDRGTGGAGAGAVVASGGVGGMVRHLCGWYVLLLFVCVIAIGMSYSYWYV